MAKGDDFRSAIVGGGGLHFFLLAQKNGYGSESLFYPGGLSLGCGTTPHRQSEACNKRQRLLGDLVARGTLTEYEQLNQPLRVRAERAAGTRLHSVKKLPTEAAGVP